MSTDSCTGCEGGGSPTKSSKSRISLSMLFGSGSGGTPGVGGGVSKGLVGSPQNTNSQHQCSNKKPDEKGDQKAQTEHIRDKGRSKTMLGSFLGSGPRRMSIATSNDTQGEVLRAAKSQQSLDRYLNVFVKTRARGVASNQMLRAQICKNK